MRGKEGVVATTRYTGILRNAFALGATGETPEETAKDNYNRGLRAYIQHGEMVVTVKEQFVFAAGYRVSKDEEQIKAWESLRAYQDEQRKKGEPIEWAGTDSEWPVINRWLNADYEIDSNLYRYCVSGTIKSDTKHPEIIVFSKDRYRTGQFTNFRWRPGHGPKRKSVGRQDGQNICSDPDCIVCRKGGSNG